MLGVLLLLVHDLNKVVNTKVTLCYLSIFKLLLIEQRGLLFYKPVPTDVLIFKREGTFSCTGIKKFAIEYNSLMRNFNFPLKKILSMNGLGLKASYSRASSKLVFRLGFSHKPCLRVWPEITVFLKKNLIYLQSVNKESLGLYAFKIRKLRMPDPYKGKGIWDKVENKFLKIAKKK